MSLPEDSLIKSIKNGDNKAFEYIFKNYYRGLCAYAYTFLNDRNASEEIVQDFFSELWIRHASLEVKLSLKLYIFRGIHNRCINYLKSIAISQRRFEKYTQYLLEEVELLDINTESDEYERLFSDSLENTIREAIDALALQQKQVFTLSRFHQKSYAEIATELDISINTVKTQMSRALQKLRNHLMGKIKNHPFILFLLTINCLNQDYFYQFPKN